MDNVYIENGYIDRDDYLEGLASEYCVPDDIVYNLADLLGKAEDFDGLISALEDCVDYKDW